jgi:hypothetical protein
VALEREMVELEACPACSDIAAVVHTVTIDDAGEIVLDLRGSVLCKNSSCEYFVPVAVPTATLNWQAPLVDSTSATPRTHGQRR